MKYKEFGYIEFEKDLLEQCNCLAGLFLHDIESGPKIFCYDIDRKYKYVTLVNGDIKQEGQPYPLMALSPAIAVQSYCGSFYSYLGTQPPSMVLAWRKYPEIRLMNALVNDTLELSWMNSDPSGLSHWRSVAETGRPEADYQS